MPIKQLIQTLKGGAGSGHRGHSGIPGQRGGSLPGAGGSAQAYVGPPGQHRKFPIGTELALQDGTTMVVDRSNGYVISGTVKGSNRFTSIDLRNTEAKISKIPEVEPTKPMTPPKAASAGAAKPADMSFGAQRALEHAKRTDQRDFEVTMRNIDTAQELQDAGYGINMGRHFRWDKARLAADKLFGI